MPAAGRSGGELRARHAGNPPPQRPQPEAPEIALGQHAAGNQQGTACGPAHRQDHPPRAHIAASSDSALEAAAIRQAEDRLPVCREFENAHGTSTPLGDKNESEAIKLAFGAHAHKLVVNSTKSMTGHLLGGAGGIESVFTVLALHRQVSPPTINIFNQDPECDLDYCANAARELKIDYAVKNNFGFGGTNGTLVFGRV